MRPFTLFNNNPTVGISPEESQEVVDLTKKFIESPTNDSSLVLTDVSGNELVKFKEFLRVIKYERIFNYTWTCPQQNEQYDIVLSSNMDLDNIKPGAAKVHEVTLSFIKNGETKHSFEAHSFGSNYNENYFSQISSIVNELGLDQCISSVRAAWDSLIDFLNVSHLLSFDNLVYPNELNLFSKFGVNAKWNETDGAHILTFQSWENQDCTDVKGFRKEIRLVSPSNPYIASIEYQNHVLEYVETSIISLSGVIFYQSELKFDSKRFYKAIFKMRNPRKQNFYSKIFPDVKCPAYRSGMVVELDERDVNHASVKFANSILKKFNLEEDERNWIAFVKHLKMKGLDLILGKIPHWKSNSFLFACLLKYARQEEQVAYSDLVINTF